jgi:hypothetical protein
MGNDLGGISHPLFAYSTNQPVASLAETSLTIPPPLLVTTDEVII